METELRLKAKTWSIEKKYHSELTNKDYTAQIIAVQEADGKITLNKANATGFDATVFQFIESDPDRVIAIARMMTAFAEMVKEDNKKLLT